MNDSGGDSNPLKKVTDVISSKSPDEEGKGKNISKREFGKLLGLGSVAGAGTLVLSDATKAVTRVNPNFLSLEDGGDLRFGSDDDFELRYDSASAQLELVGTSQVWNVSSGGSFNLKNRNLDVGSGSITSTNGTIWDSNNGYVPISALDPSAKSITLSTGHSFWGSGITSEEIDRVNLQSGETLEVQRIEFLQKGGGSSTSASVDVYDATANSVIGSQTLGGTTKNPGSSGQGNTILFRISNSTGSDIQASVKIRYAIK